jgi:hypothetical protein
MDDTAQVVRGLLAYGGLLFEPGCLKFYETIERSEPSAQNRRAARNFATACGNGVTTSRGWGRSSQRSVRRTNGSSARR